MAERRLLGIAHDESVKPATLSLRAPKGCEAILSGEHNTPAAIISQFLIRIMFSLFFPAVLLLSSCTSLPKIIVLHDPLTAEEHLSLGLAYELDNEFDPALDEYRKAYKKDKKDYRSLFYMGNIHYRKKEYDAAEKYYRKALKIAPDKGDIHNNLSWVYIDTGRFDKAKDEVEKALVSERSPFYLDTLANVYDRMGRHQEAIDVLNEALKITGPEDKELLYNEYKLLSELYMKTGEDEMASQIRVKMKEIRP